MELRKFLSQVRDNGLKKCELKVGIIPSASERSLVVIFTDNSMFMISSVLADFYERDIRKLIEEVNLFKNEENLWRTHGSVRNSSGNLALHIIGGTNYLIGATLAQTGYVRDRDQEFSRKGVPRKDLVAQLEELIPMINKTMNALNPEDMEAEYPLIFDNARRSNGYIFVQLLLHLNYHLGQVNYLRRMLE